MPGNPNSRNLYQRKPYVKQIRDGKTINSKGFPVPKESPEAHIPLKKYKVYINEN